MSSLIFIWSMLSFGILAMRLYSDISIQNTYQCALVCNFAHTTKAPQPDF